MQNDGCMDYQTEACIDSQINGCMHVNVRTDVLRDVLMNARTKGCIDTYTDLRTDERTNRQRQTRSYCDQLCNDAFISIVCVGMQCNTC